jgi:hypothetical protein
MHDNKQDKCFCSKLNVYKIPQVRVKVLHIVNECGQLPHITSRKHNLHVCVLCVETGVWGSVSEATVQEDCSHNQNGGQSKRKGTSNDP